MKKTDSQECRCPYCDQPLNAPFCLPCKVELTYCSECNKLISKNEKICPHCGKQQK
ncbi:MAG: zinc ribbon domain-containing protein [candidate division WOR-3 bacterium]